MPQAVAGRVVLLGLAILSVYGSLERRVQDVGLLEPRVGGAVHAADVACDDLAAHEVRADPIEAPVAA